MITWRSMGNIVLCHGVTDSTGGSAQTVRFIAARWVKAIPSLGAKDRSVHIPGISFCRGGLNDIDDSLCRRNPLPADLQGYEPAATTW